MEKAPTNFAPSVTQIPVNLFDLQISSYICKKKYKPMPSFAPFIEEDILTEVDDTDLNDAAKLLVYNDDVNTFEWVIECFMKVLRHTSEQAEQLSYLIHFKGKAVVKSGSLDELRPHKNALVERGLSAVIEE